MPHRHNSSRETLPHIKARQTLAGSYGSMARYRALGILDGSEEEIRMMERDFVSMIEISTLHGKIVELQEEMSILPGKQDRINEIRTQISLQREKNQGFKEGLDVLSTFDRELNAIALSLS